MTYLQLVWLARALLITCVLCFVVGRWRNSEPLVWAALVLSFVFFVVSVFARRARPSRPK